MKILPIFALLAKVFAEESESDVVVLTPDNFDDFLKENEVALVEFYAPWCGHCKQLAPTYEEIATELKGEIAVAKCDVDEHKDLAGKYEIQGFPTIKVWKQGTWIEHKGSRDKDSIIKEVKRIADPSYTPPKPAVVELTAENFLEYVQGEDHTGLTFVMFYAPWCGHCKKMKEPLEQAAQELKSSGNTAVIAKVDATQEGELARKYDVNGYPTLKYFKKGVAFDYKGGRETHQIVEEIEKLTGDASKPFASVGEAKKMVFQNRQKSTLVGCFESAEDEGLEKFKAAFDSYRDEWIKVRHTYDPEIKKAIECKDGEWFMVHDFLFRDKNYPRIQISSAEDVEANKMPFVGELVAATRKDIYGAFLKPHVYVVGHFDFDPQYRKASQLIRKDVMKVAKKFDAYHFILVDEDTFREDVKKWNLADTSEDINIVIVNQAGQIFPVEFDDLFSADELTRQMKRYENGKVKRYIKSAKAPKKNNGPVKIVVGNTFDKIVMDEKKDVLIEFYAPWCGHCKALEPKYKKFAKSVVDSHPDLVVAKFDSIDNDIPNDAFEVSGFPTIYYVDKKNNVIKFDGDRSVKGFTEFVNEQLKFPEKPGPPGTPSEEDLENIKDEL